MMGQRNKRRKEGRKEEKREEEWRGGKRRRKLKETLKFPLSLGLREWLPKSFFLSHSCGQTEQRKPQAL